MKNVEVVLVTGMSGAGKSTAMAIFENMGYYCIEIYLGDALQAIRELTNMDWINLTVVFLDCENMEILKRYKQTRRSHPMMIMNKANTLYDSIELERQEYEQIKTQADLIIDTTLLKRTALQDRLEASFYHETGEVFRVSFVSFGYKFGIPKDADLLLDVRFLPNPFYIPELRNKTGNDKEVYDYVMEKPETQEFIKRTLSYYDYLLKEYEKEGKMQLIVGIGCTGGQHRSVTLTNFLADHYKKYYKVYKWHRDADH